MIDIDKVKIGLECCIEQMKKDVYCETVKCPYYKPITNNTRLLCWAKLNRDALQLIQLQQMDIEVMKQTMQSMMEGQCIMKG